VQLIDNAMDSVRQPTAASPATAAPQFDNSPNRGRDLAIPSAGGGGGGGAVDPVAAILILGCVAAAFVGRASRKQSGKEHGQ
jgi:hypothetical protein